MENAEISYALLVGLAIALVIAIGTDLWKRSIYNWLTFTVALAAPAWWWATGIELWPDVAIQLGLAVAVFFFGALMFAIGGMAGGDVKLMTALALWFPPTLFLKFFIFVALFGGVVTFIFGGWYVLSKKHRQSDDDAMLGTIGADDEEGKPKKKKILIPYGIAIALAGLWIIYSEYAVALRAAA